MTKVYIAAPYIEKGNMPAIGKQVEDAGLGITHKWWTIDTVAEGQETAEELAHQAHLDMQGVLSADVVLLINSKKSEGKAVEQGLALSMGIPIVAVGKLGGHSKNVFHYLRDYTWVDTLDEAIELCQQI